MGRGTSRRVIVVESPDTNLFEQAIFIVRSDAVGKDGVTEDDLLQQARSAAGQYVRSRVPGARLTARRLLRDLAFAVMGGALVGLAWFFMAIL